MQRAQTFYIGGKWVAPHSQNQLDVINPATEKSITRMVHVNGARLDVNAPFGGYRQSRNGREFGVYGLREFLETKAIKGVVS